MRESKGIKQDSFVPGRRVGQSPPEKTTLRGVFLLQRVFGNQATQRLFRAGVLQAKLRIGPPNDIFEQEADRVADEVMRMPDSGGHNSETVRAAPMISGCRMVVGEALQRQIEQPFDEEEGLVEGGLVQAKSLPGETQERRTDLAAKIGSLRSGGQFLSSPIRAYMEERLNRDFSEVRIHTNTQAEEMAQSVNARAFTVGQSIVFGRGQYAPATKSGKGLLAHELAHVIQQGRAPHKGKSITRVGSQRHADEPRNLVLQESSLKLCRQESGGFAPHVAAVSGESSVIRRVRWNPNTDTGNDSYPWRTGPHGDVLAAATDAGTTLDIWRPHDGTTYWCHGFTFGGSTARGGPYSLWGQMVPTVLQDDGWRPVDSCVAGRGDIMIFYDQSGHEAHSGIIRHVAAPGGSVDEAASTLESKWGMLPLGIASWLTNAAAYGRYRCYSKAPAYGPCMTGGVNELSEGGEEECPGYQPGEKNISYTPAGHLDPDVTMLGPGQLLIADFGVGWRGIKGSTRGEPLLRSWLSTFESDQSYRLRIFGYSDCVGTIRANIGARRGRAESVESLLRPSARSRVDLRDAAAPGVFVTGNMTQEGRARNRGVVIEFRRESVSPSGGAP